jgi:hypothetical protein
VSFWTGSMVAASGGLHIDGRCVLTGPLDAVALEAPLWLSVTRASRACATCFVTEADGQVVLSITPAEAGFGLTREDVSALSDEALQERIAALTWPQPIRFGCRPLFRAQLLTVSAEIHILCGGRAITRCFGRLVVGLLLNEVSALYREAVTGSRQCYPIFSRAIYADYAACNARFCRASGLRLRQPGGI